MPQAGGNTFIRVSFFTEYMGEIIFLDDVGLGRPDRTQIDCFEWMNLPDVECVLTHGDAATSSWAMIYAYNYSSNLLNSQYHWLVIPWHVNPATED